MDDTARPLPCVQSIHNPPARGKALLLLPEGLLLRWPDREPLPAIGDEFVGTVVSVPPHLRRALLLVLFSPDPLERCEAAERIAASKTHRRNILAPIFSRTYVQKMLAAAERLDPEQRAQLAAKGTKVSIRKLLHVTASTVLVLPQDEPAPPSRT